jgi:hypothetical protein
MVVCQSDNNNESCKMNFMNIFRPFQNRMGFENLFNVTWNILIYSLQGLTIDLKNKIAKIHSEIGIPLDGFHSLFL